MLTATQINQKLSTVIDGIVSNKEIYTKNPKKDFTRNNKLTMHDVIYALLSMSGGSLTSELHEYTKVKKVSFSKSAFVQQRAKILPEAFRDIAKAFTNHLPLNKTFRNYRLLAADGSRINISKNPDSKTFVVVNQYGEGFNAFHFTALFDLENLIYTNFVIRPQSEMDEREALCEMLEKTVFESNTIIMMDRGFESYNTINHLLTTPNIDFVCRGRTTPRLKILNDLSLDEEFDEDVSCVITTTQTNVDKENNYVFIQTGSKKGKINSPNTVISKWDFPSPYPLKLRAVNILLDNGTYELIYTSLPREHFSPDDIKYLYFRRWGIETSFRELKYCIGITRLHCRKEEFAIQEIYAAIVMYNYSQMIASISIVEQKKTNKYVYKINFSMACRICKETLRERKTTDDIIYTINKYVTPVRPGRNYRRNITSKGFVSFVYRVAA